MMPWLWLAAGAALLPFTFLQTTLPLAAWGAPVLLLRFTRTVRARWALPALVVASAAGTAISFRGALSGDQIAVLAAGGGVLGAVPYALDRLLGRWLSGLPRTLVFPAADVALAFLFSTGDNGTMGHPVGTQVGNLPLLQSVSVAGLWGLAFLIAWTAPVANEVWERGFDLRAAGWSAAVWACVLTAVLLLGGARLVFDRPAGPTVRVAALAPNRAASDAAMAARVVAGPRGAAERAELRRRYFTPMLDDLLDRTVTAARAGARIVVWSEAAAYDFAEEGAAVVERARAVAREERIYLQIGVVYLLPRELSPYVEIRAIMIDPGGTLVWNYLKTSTPVGDGNVPGPGVVPIADTPYGRLATVICYDANFMPLVRQAGRAGADILLLPSSDWEPVTDALAQQAVLRGVENGMSVVRPARRGTSMAVDHQGRMIGYEASWFTGDARTTDHAMVITVPVQGRLTYYGRWVGDAVAWLCLAGLLAMAATAGARRFRPAAPRSGTAGQAPAPAVPPPGGAA
ncbi:nitrilase-related carbon-nitrogen hydrolase [Nonomuraea sp. B19D2]|uniref:nitrilase-related carbon-nitrogen hydrolase n=1 Tax=Nonomuraea sp. B19D2 TaxID=3159561 RepID=UPI0032DB2B25